MKVESNIFFLPYFRVRFSNSSFSSEQGQIRTTFIKAPLWHIPILNCLACVKTSPIPLVARGKVSLPLRGSMTRYWISAAQIECRRENRQILPPLTKQISRPHSLAPCPFEPLRRGERKNQAFTTGNPLFLFLLLGRSGVIAVDEELLNCARCCRSCPNNCFCTSSKGVCSLSKCN